MTTPIQLLLISALSAMGLVALARLGKPLASRMVVLTLLLTAILCVLHPELTTMAARRMGVGRGTDLIIYLGSLIFTYLLLLSHLRMLRLERQLRTVIREHSIQTAHFPDSPQSHPSP